MTEVLFGSTAFLAAIVTVLCIAVALHLGRNRERGLIPYIFYPAILVAIVQVMFSGRNLYLPSDYRFATLPDPPLVAWITRLTSLFILFAAGERIAKRFLHHGRTPDAPTMLILAFWLYVFSNVVSPALFGTHASFSHMYLYTALAGYAALLIGKEEGETAIRSARNAFFAFLVVSALCILWRPELVLSRGYQGLIPGLDIRYDGLAPNANSLAPVSIVFLLCLWAAPYSTRSLTLLGWAIGCASLLFAQSKTNWVAFVLCTSCVLYFKHRDVFARSLSDFRRPLLPAIFILLIFLATTLVAAEFMFGGAAERIASFLDTATGANLLALSGRNQLWEVVLKEWHNNPLFGYGLTIWNDAYRARIGMLWAFHAHNQAYQSLASAGVVGVVGLAIYVVTLFWFALKTAKGTQGLTLALFVLMLVRAISEVPLSMTSGYGLIQLMHILLLAVIASQYGPSRYETRGTSKPSSLSNAASMTSRSVVSRPLR
jgi:exopolysaccharide production protein ExoQ